MNPKLLIHLPPSHLQYFKQAKGGLLVELEPPLISQMQPPLLGNPAGTSFEDP